MWLPRRSSCTPLVGTPSPLTHSGPMLVVHWPAANSVACVSKDASPTGMDTMGAMLRLVKLEAVGEPNVMRSDAVTVVDKPMLPALSVAYTCTAVVLPAVRAISGRTCSTAKPAARSWAVMRKRPSSVPAVCSTSWSPSWALACSATRNDGVGLSVKVLLSNAPLGSNSWGKPGSMGAVRSCTTVSTELLPSTAPLASTATAIRRLVPVTRIRLVAVNRPAASVTSAVVLMRSLKSNTPSPLRSLYSHTLALGAMRPRTVMSALLVWLSSGLRVSVLRASIHRLLA